MAEVESGLGALLRQAMDRLPKTKLLCPKALRAPSARVMILRLCSRLRHYAQHENDEHPHTKYQED
jgi:hypothetical protein